MRIMNFFAGVALSMVDTHRTKQDLETLKQTQVYDQQIYQLRLDLESIPAELRRLEEGFQAKQKEVAVIEERLKRLKLKQKEKEIELGQKEEHVRQLEGKLMMVKTNKEYTALKQEIATAKADNSLLEEEIIGLLDQVDEVAVELEQGRAGLKSEEAALLQGKGELQRKSEQGKKQISELTEKRESLIRQVDSETASLYEKIIAKKNGVALATVNGENCSACLMKLRPQVLNEVKLAETIVVCESCNRILYEE